MICPNCKSIIPDDSKFCPDCGTPVVNIDELRAKAKEITIQYKKGYDFFVNDGVLPRFVYNLTAANCEKIVAAQHHIIARQQEIEAAERKQKEAHKVNIEELRAKAKEITIQYDKGYDFYVNDGVLPHFVSNLNADNCNKIIAAGTMIKVKHNQLFVEESSRKSAERIAQEYAKGYEFFVRIGIFPPFRKDLDIAIIQKIIKRTSAIVRRHQEIEVAEREEELKKQKRQSLLNELNRLGITDSDKRNMFIEHPDRLKSEYWLNWAKENQENNSARGGNNSMATYWWEWPIAIVIIIITLLLMFC